MTAELGHYALILAAIVAIAQSIVPLIGAQKRWADWMEFSVPTAQVQFLLVGISFAMLTWAFVTSDFSVELVAANSHSDKPMLYKVTGVWGNHEGSLLLWVLTLALFGAMVAWWGDNLPPTLKARVLSVQAMVGVAFYAFILFTSNPFTRLEFPPMDGNDLNPLLQDPGLAFHPPFLYIGYVGLSTTFSFAVAALIEGKVTPAWARWVRPWALAAWVCLTIGIGLGSWWAYYELGWGGWWFWDPVENASFMPWLISAALLHSAIVTEKRNTLKSWTILLAILAFSFSLIGTFIVRSGVITSVHAFASDPTRGMFILGILAVSIGGALTLFALRAHELRSNVVFGVLSRESALVMNNVLLAVSAGVVFIGTLWPLIAEFLTGAKISVGPPFFNIAFTPFFVALGMILPIGAMMPWKRAKLGKTIRPLTGAIALSLAVGCFIWATQTGGGMIAPIGGLLATWLVLGAATDLAFRAKAGQVSGGETFRRLRNLPRADWGKATAHSGLGILMFAAATITVWQTEDIRTMTPGDTFEKAGYTLRFDGVERARVENYISDMAQITAFKDGEVVAILNPEKRFYPVQSFPTTEAAIDRSITRDLYISLGDRQDDGSWAVRTWVKPYANWLWVGMLMMAFGGILSLTDRRFRIGAPAQKGSRVAAVPAE
ncbi:cytochrome c-type biogenesis protein CcmF [Rubricella aquisinus]|uniref:Cytochrome c-type biogenesis protein CcmF n=1 Tax=Rubricella aquisinus TaxID=2028108 RepID=A0A840WL32_9RHOB|nr:heme lyase CcmF/NrfE family subunit [Rubricella aquisinus]MBB5514863.1 cytochrome c-type biogenesis protein CcmF [Rubricella aquisinus]